MSAERWQRVRELFDRAVELPVAKREAFLNVECSKDEGLRAEVKQLLEVDAESGKDGELLSEGAPFEVLELHDALAPGTRLGDYRILERIASGGMGTAYMAEQQHPRRIVALKTMRFGLQTGAICRGYGCAASNASRSNRALVICSAPSGPRGQSASGRSR